MNALLIILLVAFIIFAIYMAVRTSQKNDTAKPKFTIEVSTGSSDVFNEDEKKIPKVVAAALGADTHQLQTQLDWNFTLKNLDAADAEKIVSIINNSELYEDMKNRHLTPIFAEKNIICTEVDDFISKLRSTFNQNLKSLIAGNSEWSSLGSKDKADLLSEYQEKALVGIHELPPGIDIVFLLSYDAEKIQMTMDDALIRDYGMDLIQGYMRFAADLDKVRVAPQDNRNRPLFDSLAAKGLAVRGTEIDISEILAILTLKDLNVIAGKSDGFYKRKNIAIEELMKLPNLKEKLGDHISFREIFKLKALPDSYGIKNLEEVASNWAYVDQIVTLIVKTISNAQYNYSRGFTESSYFKKFKVDCYRNYVECPLAVEYQSRQFSLKDIPKFPAHIGCTCTVSPVLDA